jgi:hypothetical protein
VLVRNTSCWKEIEMSIKHVTLEEIEQNIISKIVYSLTETLVELPAATMVDVVGYVMVMPEYKLMS